MNEELLNIKSQLENLSNLIDKYVKSTSQESIILTKDDMHKIKHIGKLNSYIHVFNYNNGVLFILKNSSSYPNHYSHYGKLFSGELKRLILNKLETPYNDNGMAINYELESSEKTRLRDLYK